MSKLWGSLQYLFLRPHGGTTKWGFIKNEQVAIDHFSSGINPIRSEETPSNEQYFSVDGKVCQKPLKGLNIVRTSDGKVRKVIKR